MTRKNIKFSVKGADILGVLQYGRQISGKSEIPIIKNVMLTAEKDHIEIQSTDLDMHVTATVAADIQEPGCTTVSLDMLSSFVSKIERNAVITFTQADTNLGISVGRTRAKLHTLPPEDFPAIPVSNSEWLFTIESAELLRMIRHVEPCISSEETRYYLCGVYMHIRDKRLRFVATDGHRLGLSDGEMPAGMEEMPGIIVPAKAVKALLKLAEKSDKVEISGSRTYIEFSANGISFRSKLIDGTFPDYERVIPRQNDKRATIERREIEAVVNRVATVSSDRGAAVKFAFDTGRLQISCNSADFGNAEETLDVTYEAVSLNVGFNSRYVTGLLHLLKSDIIEIAVNDPGSPALITGQDDQTSLYVLMPMRV